MALYLKCPKCGLCFIDFNGENAKDDTNECYMHGPYLCPSCGTEANYLENKNEYDKAPTELKYNKI